MELYVHIPFCVRKCDYCDFLSFSADDQIKDRYMNALKAELEAISEQCSNEEVTTIFFGGGTPSVLRKGQIFGVMETVRREFVLSQDCEISIESNPGTLHEAKLREYWESGINRLSIGCQSTSDEELRRLGRIHTFSQFREQYELARRAGFRNINVDLMSAIPGQSIASWKRNLRIVAGMEPEHISAYSLIVEEGTPFYERELSLPSEEEERQMYAMTAEILGEYGYHRYEISNYAREGMECRHNGGYWRREDYLGVGLGAASLWKNQRFSNTRDMENYLEHSADSEHIRENVEFLSEADRMEEFMFLGLRMTEGISSEGFRKEFTKDIGEVYGEQIKKFCDLGLLEEKSGRFRLTEQGISLSNQVFVEFLL